MRYTHRRILPAMLGKKVGGNFPFNFFLKSFQAFTALNIYSLKFDEKTQLHM